MTLRERSFDHDRSQYNDYAAEYAIILRRLFPDLRWRVLDYESLLQQRWIAPNSPPPSWVLIEATSKNKLSSQSVQIDLSFFEQVSSPEGLLSIVGDRLRREVR